MIETAFPVVGTILVVFALLPLAALVTRGLLEVAERGFPGAQAFGFDSRYVLLVSSSLVPLLWFASAGFHESELGSQFALSCLTGHEKAPYCFEPALFAALLMTVSFGIAMIRRTRTARPLRAGDARELEARVAALVAQHDGIRGIIGRVIVSDEAALSIETHGLLRPTVYLGRSFADRMSDEMLLGALSHEFAHVRRYDPLRFGLLRLALDLNPVGRLLLETSASRWLLEQESHCDREAVADGASPLSLAEAILAAARPTRGVALGTPDTAVLRFRVARLLGFSERLPRGRREIGRAALPAALLLFFLAVGLPHNTGTLALDLLHAGAEHPTLCFLR